MCSIIFSSHFISNFEAANKYAKPRGPDYTSLKTIGTHSYVHNLLSITGEFTIQPIIEDDIVLLFNGEVYNYKEFGKYSCDTHALIPLYKKFGKDFIKKLDGEFAIVLHDRKKDIIIVSTDIFGTKPLFWSNDHTRGICVGASTYHNSLAEAGYSSIEKMKANTTLIFDKGELEVQSVYDFDLNQHKTSFDDWSAAFERSIRKRASNGNGRVFIGLSSGYDSGAIACELNKQGLEYKAYSVTGRENMQILSQRYQSIKDLTVTTISPQDREKAHQHLLKTTEEWKYTIRSGRSDYNEYYLSLWDDNGSNHLSHVCALAKADGKKILLSGAGADEIFSDYGYNGESKYAHSNFGGLFPDDLNSIFPWPSFFESSMESYLMKDEVVCGSYGIEGRYPFLDKDVVQEFLWTTANLKNYEYKGVLAAYMRSNFYPFAQNEKIGF